MPPKGRKPAHQNTFAFRHNPKSKKTAQILQSPNIHVCRRCHDKIEWRKQYRKYKPLTQPSKCNICQERNVRRAYHTVCDKCGMESPQAQEFLREWNQQHEPATRVCGVCFKEPVIMFVHNESTDETGGVDTAAGPMKLRERKRIERQLQGGGASSRKTENGDSEGEDNSNEDGGDSEPYEDYDDDDDVNDDPFVRAVGGVDKLLTGEAYQQMLLQQHATNDSTTKTDS